MLRILRAFIGMRRRRPLLAKPREGVELVGPCHVIDGDTIVIGRNHIRLAGIDAPEIDRPFGQKSKWTLVELCKGRRVRAVLTSDTSHNRFVAVCYLDDGRDLSAEMVRRGMALDWPVFSGGRYRHLEPAGVRRKLFEKARVVTGSHDPRYRSVGSILSHGIEVRAHCHSCDLTLEVSASLLQAAYGRDLQLIGRLSPCRRVGCDGKAIFLAKGDRGFVPLL